MSVQVYGDSATKKTAVYKWVKHFSEGRESVTDEERSGRPGTSRTEENIAKVRQIVRENSRLTVRSIAEQVNIYRETVREILTGDLDMRKCVQKWSQRSSPKNESKEEFLATKQITVLKHPTYSPDLAPSDFFLFPKIKEILKGMHFDYFYDIRSNTMAALKAIPQSQFQNCFEGWTRRWHRCVASQGEYFEGDHSGIQQ